MSRPAERQVTDRGAARGQPARAQIVALLVRRRPDRPLLPYHPYTKSAQHGAPLGKVTRYDVEIFPTFDTLAKGHRLRVTISTADFPHALPSIAQTPGLLLGIYSLEHSPSNASSLELPLIPGTRGLRPISRGPLP